jgi:hypothetical protein
MRDIEHIIAEVEATPGNDTVGYMAAAGIIQVLGGAGYVIVPKVLSDDVVAAADEVIGALPLEQRRVDGLAKLNTLRNIWRIILEKV